ncbi:glycosyltransferase family 4 protein [Sphingomonas sp. TZW2008]|uniref:glycosyltransferase family 4 protein n=1 Tax=Sphingomonas sp. TZW2008 TaxID=1917973 RepID=UPI00211A799D|nr:glycosyltransferase family 4 protein [Sphingomonas sp. TZW2008]
MNAPLRLLMTADALGGVWTYAVDLARALRGLDIETVIAVLGSAPDAAQRRAAGDLRIVDTGLPLDWLAADAAAVRAAARSLAVLVTAEDVDLVQINQPALAAEPMPVPVVVAVHSCVATWWAAAGEGAPPADFAWQTALVAEGLARAAAVVCPSAAFAADVARVYDLPQEPRIVHNGRSPLMRAPQPVADVAFTAGRLWDRGKNVAVLDRAAALLPVSLRAAGPLVAPHGERVTLAHAEALGSLEEAALAGELARRPVFASAARYEPFGLAVLEAAQAECALVLADIPTFRELWDGAATFVPCDDAAGFADAIKALLEDPVRRAGAGDAAAQRAARYSVATMAQGMAAIYRAVGVPADAAAMAPRVAA